LGDVGAQVFFWCGGGAACLTFSVLSFFWLVRRGKGEASGSPVRPGRAPPQPRPCRSSLRRGHHALPGPRLHVWGRAVSRFTTCSHSSLLPGSNPDPRENPHLRIRVAQSPFAFASLGAPTMSVHLVRFGWGHPAFRLNQQPFWAAGSWIPTGSQQTPRKGFRCDGVRSRLPFSLPSCTALPDLEVLGRAPPPRRSARGDVDAPIFVDADYLFVVCDILRVGGLASVSLQCCFF